MTAGQAPSPDIELARFLDKKGFSDATLQTIMYEETAPHLTKPGEKEFFNLLRKVLEDSSLIIHHWGNYPGIPLAPYERRKIQAAFVAMNVCKVARYFGFKWGPNFIEHIKFPIWRPSFWSHRKGYKYSGFVGIAPAEWGHVIHPMDLVMSSRYHNCVMIQETPVPEIHAKEDYEAHHKHGLHTLARLMTLSFIDIDSTKRTFRFYCVQGCSRLYSWDELNDPEIAAAVRTKILVKGRVPRTKDFDVIYRDQWDPKQAQMIKAAQARILSAMPALAPLLPIKMALSELIPHCVINIAPIIASQFLDGRTGMSYGFLAFQLPTGPVEECTKVTVLVTRSGCDKQNPHPNDDWILLSFDPTSISLEVSRALGDITSPSFDSWLILSQAATNVALARRFKAAGRSKRYVEMVEQQGVALAHFHGFVKREALPANVAFFGQDRLPLPCGSVESAMLTIEEKTAIADKVLALDHDIDYAGDIHVEPDHGCVLSTDFATMEKLAAGAKFGLKYFETYKCASGCCKDGSSFDRWRPNCKRA